MVLADGTRVMLNAETRLRFPEAFGDGERRVFLEGEAYFEVAKERERPFWVDFREGTVRVLGTQFNVKAYGGEEAVATLVHGKVEVARGQEAVVLQPGEQCRIAAGEAHALIVGKADLMSTLAWKNGEFVFKDASLEQVIDELARWYNVEMMYDHSLFRESNRTTYRARVHACYHRTTATAQPVPPVPAHPASSCLHAYPATIRSNQSLPPKAHKPPQQPNGKSSCDAI